MTWKKSSESLPDYGKTILFRFSHDDGIFLAIGKLDSKISPHEALTVSVFESTRSSSMTRQIPISEVDIWMYADAINNFIQDIETKDLVTILKFHDYLSNKIHYDVINEVIYRIHKKS